MVIWVTTLVLGIIGAIAAVLLFVAAKRFRVVEDPRIGEVESLLPGANCGGCGFTGCHALAEACCKATSMEGLSCPGAGPEVMAKISKIVGLAVVKTVPKVAVVGCNGTCELRPRLNHYDGVSSCAIENSFYTGETLCQYGCLGCFDCVGACPYGAMSANPATGLPQVDISKCVGCGKCVKACPRGVMQLVENPGDKPIVYVACQNHDKGGQAMKECGVACIGCMKCQKVCPSDAVTIDTFLSEIDTRKCVGCMACVEACPRHSILTIDPVSQANRP